MGLLCSLGTHWAASLIGQREADRSRPDVWDHLIHDEWETAITLLEELGDVPPLSLGFREDMATAAEQLRLGRSAAWCRWRCYEARHGVIRADLTLRPAGEARRQAAFSGAGVLRPMWDIGNPGLNIAALWAEFTPLLEPGGRATVRLAPLVPVQWRRLRAGQVITMYEDRTVGGTAVVLEVQPSSVVVGPGCSRS